MSNSFGTGMVLLWASLVIAVGWGWILNVIALTNVVFTGHEVEAILRIVGVVVVPLGAVMGWFV